MAKNLDSTEEPAVFGIIDKLSTRFGNTLAGIFVSNSNKIALRAFRGITRDEPTEYAGKDPSYIHFLKPKSIFENTIVRSILAESNKTFVTLQSFKRRPFKVDYTIISKDYRSIIRSLLQKLKNAIEIDNLKKEEKTECDNEIYQEYISIFYSIECIWHLCEILFMQPTSEYPIVLSLLDWIRFHFSTVERSATDLLLSGHEAGQKEDYWPTLKGLIIQGQADIMCALLKIHNEAESTPFKLSLQIIQSMPIYNPSSGMTVEKFRSQFKYWRINNERKLSYNILSTQPQLENIIKLILGDTVAWNAEIEKSECWYEYLPGFLFYTNPTCKHFELGGAANDYLLKWAQLKGIDRTNLELKKLDQLILSLMQYDDLYQVIYHIQTIGDNQWFVTHLTDLLYNCGQLHRVGGRHQIDDSVQLRNSLLMEFGRNLITYNLELGIDYLEQCSIEGKGALELLLPRLSIRTEKQALRIITIAHQKGFFNTEQTICKIQSRRSFGIRRYGNALEWAIRSKDTILVTSIADFILKHYTKTGEILCQDMISKLGRKMLISPRLIYLCKYLEFYKDYRKKEFLNAANILIILMESNSTPEYFWPSLLIDSIPLLESKDPKLMSKETYTIMGKIESKLIPLIEKTKKNLEMNPDSTVEILKDYRMINIEDIVNLLRLACARNLARTIIIESTLKKGN